jgi:hypothetical protein
VASVSAALAAVVLPLAVSNSPLAATVAALNPTTKPSCTLTAASEFSLSVADFFTTLAVTSSAAPAAVVDALAAAAEAAA